jgi:hypothetical protein
MVKYIVIPVGVTAQFSLPVVLGAVVSTAFSEHLNSRVTQELPFCFRQRIGGLVGKAVVFSVDPGGYRAGFAKLYPDVYFFLGSEGGAYSQSGQDA